MSTQITISTLFGLNNQRLAQFSLNSRLPRYIGYLFTPIALLAHIPIAVIDKNKNLGSSILKGAITNFFTVAISWLNTQAYSLYALDTMVNAGMMFQSISGLSDEFPISVIQYVLGGPKHRGPEKLGDCSKGQIIFHGVTNMILSYIVYGKALPGFMDQEAYLSLVYLKPMSNYIARNNPEDDENMRESLEKIFAVSTLSSKPRLISMHEFWNYVTNKIYFKIGDMLLSPMEIVLSLHAFLEEYHDKTIYSMAEHMSLNNTNIYDPRVFLKYFLNRFDRSKLNIFDPKSIKTIGKVNITGMLKQIMQEKDLIPGITDENIEKYRHNILQLSTERYPVYKKEQIDFLKLMATHSARANVLEYFTNPGFELFSLAIEKVVDIDANVDYLINFLNNYENKQLGKVSTESGHDAKYSTYLPMLIFNSKKLNVEFNLEKDINDFESPFYIQPIEYIKLLKNVVESTFLFYEITALISKYYNMAKDTPEHYRSHHLIGNIVKSAAIDSIPLPEAIKYMLSLRNNREIPTYLSYQFTHNGSMYEITYDEGIIFEKSNVNLLNTILITGYYIGLISPSITSIKSFTNGTPLYNRICENLYLKVHNSESVKIVQGYMNYLANTIPDVTVVYNPNQYNKIRFCINDLFRSPIDKFIEHMNKISSIIPGIASLESMILLRELTCGALKETWLEQLIDGIAYLRYCFVDRIKLENKGNAAEVIYRQSPFGRLWLYDSCYLVPDSDYSRLSSSHLIQALALNEDPAYSSDEANYYPIEPEDYTQGKLVATTGISSPSQVLSSQHKNFVFRRHPQDPSKVIMMKNNLASNSIYVKDNIRIRSSYYNKACELINEYEKVGYMLHLLLEYSHLQKLESIKFIFKNRHDENIVTVFDIKQILSYMLYEHLISPLNTSFVQIYKQNEGNYEIESRYSRPTFKKSLNKILGVNKDFIHHAQPIYYHNQDSGYAGQSLDSAILSIHSILTTIKSSQVYDIKQLKKYNMNPRWFNPNAIAKRKNGPIVIIKSTKRYEEDDKLYIGGFKYEVGVKINNNIFAINLSFIFRGIAGIARNLILLGREHDASIVPQHYVGANQSITPLVCAIIFDIIGNAAIGEFLGSRKFNIMPESELKRYRVRDAGITEYSSSVRGNILITALCLAAQASDQYTVHNMDISLMGNKQQYIGALSFRELNTLFISTMIHNGINVLMSFPRAVLRIIDFMIKVLLYLVRSINNLGSPSYKQKLAMTRKKLEAEKQKLLKEVNSLESE